MSIGETQTSTLIERTGIETVPESARIAKPRHLFMPWFAANVSVFGMSYGAWVLDFDFVVAGRHRIRDRDCDFISAVRHYCHCR